MSAIGLGKSNQIILRSWPFTIDCISWKWTWSCALLPASVASLAFEKSLCPLNLATNKSLSYFDKAFIAWSTCQAPGSLLQGSFTKYRVLTRNISQINMHGRDNESDANFTDHSDLISPINGANFMPLASILLVRERCLNRLKVMKLLMLLWRHMNNFVAWLSTACFISPKRGVRGRNLGRD